MKIGNFKPKNRYFLAPMEEVNDVVFRLLCKKAGCGLTYTGMIHPQTKQKIDIVLEAGNLLLMKGETQKSWMHSLPKTKNVEKPRINLTFRYIYN